MQRGTWLGSLIVVAALSAGVGAVAASKAAPGDPPTLALQASWSIKELLTVAQQKKVGVYLQLRNGKEYYGQVGELGNAGFVLQMIGGKEYYDAYVLYEAIDAVEVRARNR